MKYVLPIVAISLLSTQCGKDAKTPVTAMIVQKMDFNNTYVALLADSTGARYSFNCKSGTQYGRPLYNCNNAVYIRNLPAHLATPGQKIVFNDWKDFGQPVIFSSINHAHELEAYGLKAAN